MKGETVTASIVVDLCVLVVYVPWFLTCENIGYTAYSTPDIGMLIAPQDYISCSVT
jgi:hypothetical protein